MARGWVTPGRAPSAQCSDTSGKALSERTFATPGWGTSVRGLETPGRELSIRGLVASGRGPPARGSGAPRRKRPPTAEAYNHLQPPPRSSTQSHRWSPPRPPAPTGVSTGASPAPTQRRPRYREAPPPAPSRQNHPPQGRPASEPPPHTRPWPRPSFASCACGPHQTAHREEIASSLVGRHRPQAWRRNGSATKSLDARPQSSVDRVGDNVARLSSPLTNRTGRRQSRSTLVPARQSDGSATKSLESRPGVETAVDSGGCTLPVGRVGAGVGNTERVTPPAVEWK